MQTLISLLQTSFTYVIAFIILLGILIFVHELGHFLVARWNGVRVEVFSLGFGKKLWQKKVGDTTYCISLFPLGGYVKMFGDQPGADVSPEDRKVSFTHKTVGQRIAIVLAGPLMNLFFAIVVFAAVAMIGQEFRAPVVGDVEPGTVAAQAGFQSGDRILSIDGESVQTYDQAAELMDESIGKSLRFQVQRADGSVSEIKTQIESKENPNPLSLRTTIADIPGLGTNSMASIVGVPGDSPLYALGLRPGDRITHVGERPVNRFRELAPAFASLSPETPGVLKIERMNEGRANESLEVTLTGEVAQKGFAGLRLESPELYLARVIPDSPAAKAGLQPGDRMVAIDGRPVLRWTEVLSAVSGFQEANETLKIDLLRGGEALSLEIRPQVTSQMTMYGSEDKRFTIGIVPWVAYAVPDLVTQRTLNPATALAHGVEQSWDYSVMVVMSFVRLFQAKISHKTVGGILSIGQVAGETIKMGIGKFLTMMAIISINLFILNLLPIPILDGGHLVFYSIEAIKGSPVSLKKMEMAQQVGLLLLMSLMVFALFNDVSRLVFGQM